MGRNLSLLRTLPRLEPDGVTHRRDCECVRCDAGFRPTEADREAAARRWKAREQAQHAIERKAARRAVKEAQMQIAIRAQVQATEERLRQIADEAKRALQDERMRMFLELRRQGKTIDEAFAIIDGQPERQVG